MTSGRNSKRSLLKLAGLSPLAAMGRWARAADAAITRIAFGSCAHQDKPQPVWDAVLANHPDLFVFLGDNIYGDSDDPQVLAAKYRQLAAKDGFRRLRSATGIMAIWDDHDYGRNDAGREYPAKEASRQLMLEFWEEPPDSPRWRRPDGIYTSRILDFGGRRLQVILPDLRWNRTPVSQVETAAELRQRDAADMGPYRPVSDPAAVLLGENQWQWLQACFEEPVDVRLIGSSIQLLPEFTGWETWANFPRERERFLGLLARHQEVPAIILSGDVHWCELSRYQAAPLQAPVFELTSSGLTETWEKISPNRHRVGEAFAQANFGLVEIDWRQARPAIRLSVRNVANQELIGRQLPTP